MTFIEGVTSRLEDIKGLLQQLVDAKTICERIPLPVITPPPKKRKLGDASSPEESPHGMAQVN